MSFQISFIFSYENLFLVNLVNLFTLFLYIAILSLHLLIYLQYL